MWHFKWLTRVAPKKFEDLGINEVQCQIDIKVLGRNYELKILNPINNDKKLFVLDTDWTLTNDDGTLRPYVHEMLERAYRNYNIILWSGRDEVPHVHIFNRPSYNFVALLNRTTILPVNSLRNGTLEVKPLDYIWNKLPNFSKRNTVMLDDAWYSYTLNRQSGMSTNRENQSTTDGGELKRVSDYLEFIATLDNFALLHHNDWQTNLNKIYSRVESFASIERTTHDDLTIEDITTNSTITLWLSKSTTDHEMSVSSDLIDDQNKTDTDLSGIYSHESEGSKTTGPNDSKRNEELVLVRLDETPEIHFESYIRKDKKLLVINLDIMCNSEEMYFLSDTSLRPYAREFLTAAYLNYEIVIWSKENTRFMKNALDSLGLIYDGFKIAIFVEVEGMQVSINPPAYHRRNVLEKIWSEIPQFSPKNTVLVNSRYETSYNNSASELSIKPYTKERKIIDVELAVLAGYLNQISYVDDFTMIDHTIWREPEKVFEYLEHGEFESESREVVVSVIYGEENILFENIYPKTSIKDLKELISGRIAVPSAAQILRYLVPKHYIAFEYIERLNPFNIPRPRSPRMNYASHEIFPGWSPEKLYFDGNMTIGHWSYDSFIILQLSPIGDCTLPDIAIDAVTGERIVRIDLSAGNGNIAAVPPHYLNDKIPDLRCTLCNPDIYEFMIVELVEDLEIHIWNPLREGKKLLVLDVNHTLYDPNPHAEMNRPYLHEFLTRVYVHYDIVLWTEQSEEITLATVQKMGIIQNMNYKIAFCLSAKAILTVPTNEYGSIDTKPLELIWRKFPAYSAKNTIILDDHEFNFALNYQSGYTMKRYEVAKGSCDSLLRTLSGYLEGISLIDDFTKLCHRKLWLPGKIMAIDVNGELITRDSHICLTIQWRGNKLVFLNLNVTTTAQDIKNMVMNICGLAASQFSLRRRL